MGENKIKAAKIRGKWRKQERITAGNERINKMTKKGKTPRTDSRVSETPPRREEG